MSSESTILFKLAGAVVVLVFNKNRLQALVDDSSKAGRRQSTESGRPFGRIGKNVIPADVEFVSERQEYS